jgi:hypothetical protein
VNRSTFWGVEIVDAVGRPLGEFDRIEDDMFVEEKSACGLSQISPKTGLPVQTPEAWAEKQIYNKTRVRINNLARASSTRSTPGGSTSVPLLSDIQGIRHLEFRIENAAPDLQDAVERQLQRLRLEFSDWMFHVTFGE